MKKAFDVYFAGEILEGHDLETVKEAVARRFGIRDEKLEALFSGKPRRVKRNLGVEKAGRLRKAFLEAGALVRIVPAGAPPDATPFPTRRPEKATPTRTRLTLAPLEPLKPAPPPPPPKIETSTLELAQPSATKPLQEAPATPPPPDAGDLSLAPLEGAEAHQAEETPAPPPPPDVDHLEMLPPRSGSLESFTTAKDPVPIPDTSELSLGDPS